MHLPDPSELVTLMSVWGYTVVFPLSIIEGPIVSMIGGFLVSLGTFNWFVMFLVLMAGDFFGDLLYYMVGRYGHGPLVERFVRYIGVTDARMRALEEAFKKHDWKVLLINKTQAIGSVVLYYGGAVRMPLWRFLWINTLGSVPKVALFEYIGYKLGDGVLQAQTYLNDASIVTLMIPLALIAAYWMVKKWAGSEDKKEGIV